MYFNVITLRSMSGNTLNASTTSSRYNRACTYRVIVSTAVLPLLWCVGMASKLTLDNLICAINCNLGRSSVKNSRTRSTVTLVSIMASSLTLIHTSQRSVVVYLFYYCQNNLTSLLNVHIL